MDEVLTIPGAGFGILSRGRGARSPIAVVLLNAGLTHRVGPFRCYVRFARYLAERGVDVFRFDLPRVGDGPVAGATAETAIAAALDLLERQTGAQHFVVGGICSAADLAWRVAQQEPRITGLWLFDGYARRGPWYALARIRRAARRPLWQWPALALRLLGGVRTGPSAEPNTLYRDWPEPDAFRQQASRYLERGVRILAMYTGGVSSYLMHPRQLRDTFGGAATHPGLQLDYRPDLDHTLMSPADRDSAAERLGDWLAGFAAPARA
jgi:alpha-beta hydrolase superfamily lysophospholipase